MMVCMHGQRIRQNIDRHKQIDSYRQDSTLSLLYPFDDEHSPVLDSSDSSAVYVDEVSSETYFATLLQLCLTNVTVERDVLVFRVDQSARAMVKSPKAIGSSETYVPTERHG